MIGRLVLLLIVALACAQSPALAAPKADLWEVWRAHDPQSTIRVDHRPWKAFLDKFVFPRFGTSLVNYKAVGATDRGKLEAYLNAMARVPVDDLNRDEQRAYWINLYNALTVKTVIDHYPVDSIRAIDISPGLFSDGPWGAKLITIEGREVSLDDIEHRILRPIWRDSRLHYVLNCAAKSCPQMGRQPFTAENTESLLEHAASAFVNHPHGAHVRDGELIVSKIYDWYGEDFGDSDQAIIAHLRRYGDDGLRTKLDSFTEIDDYFYDWSLNELP